MFEKKIPGVFVGVVSSMISVHPVTKLQYLFVHTGPQLKAQLTPNVPEGHVLLQNLP